MVRESSLSIGFLPLFAAPPTAPDGETPKHDRPHGSPRGEASRREEASQTEPCSETTHEAPTKGSEVPRDEDDLDERVLAIAQGQTADPELEDLPREQLVDRIEELEDRLDRACNLEAKIDKLSNQLGAAEGSPSDPYLEKWTRDEFGAYLASRDLAVSTVAYYRGRVRIMEEHDHAPVDLHPPEEETWLEHIRWRKRQGQAGSTLNGYQIALKKLLRFLSDRTDQTFNWSSLDSCYKVQPSSWRLPPDDLVPEFWHHEYFPGDELKTRQLQYMMRYLFLVGPRAPSEIAEIRLEHVDRIDEGYLEFPQRKKAGKLNERPDEPAHVLTSRTEKSLKNWLDVWRPKLDADTDQVFPRWDGDPWELKEVDDPYPNLRKWLSRNGSEVWSDFSPRTGRRWYATHLLVQTGMNIYAVADRIDDEVKTVEDHYVDKAKARTGHKADWQIPRLRRPTEAVDRD